MLILGTYSSKLFRGGHDKETNSLCRRRPPPPLFVAPSSALGCRHAPCHSLPGRRPIPTSGQQQSDSVVAIVAEAQGLPLVAAYQWPLCGSLWIASNSLPCLIPPLPCPPADPGTPVYALGPNQFLADQTAGPLTGPLPPPYRDRALSAADYAAIVQAQADELQSFVGRLQARQASAQMGALDMDYPPLPPGDDGGTNVWDGGTLPMGGTPPGTNDLWLQLLSEDPTNATAALVIHPPWNVSNGVYDLLYCTNLIPPAAWQWLLRTAPGQTNLPAVSAAPPQRFYRLGLPNDLVATSSLGTNFWVAFFSVFNFHSHPTGIQRKWLEA